ncbi:hypothetical protein [Amycolatopsis sp. cmx-8-4]|uniref:hypothetical protein n=1 Tax=Amycolatopsis sp. cmx-8-4 TaxID=2790947 RepID=UPI00397AFD6C
MTIPHAHLPPPVRRVYELLADHPGPDTTAGPIAAALRITEPDATAALQRLHAASLVKQLALGDRYTLAPWARQHAIHQRVQLPDPVRAEQVTRLIDWYATTASAAVPLIAPHALRCSAPAAHKTVPHRHGDGPRALLWYAREHHVLRAILTAATDRHHDDVAVELAEAVWHLARTTYHHDDLAHAQHAGYTLTHRTRDPIAAVFRAREATALADLGHLDDALDAVADATAALDTHDPEILALVHSHSGRVHLAAGQPDNALGELAAALRYHRGVVDDHGHALVERRIGQAHSALGYHADALHHLNASSSDLTRRGHRLSAARTLTYLANALIAAGEPGKALTAAGRAHTLLGTTAALRYRAGIDLAAARARYTLGEASVTGRITEALIARLSGAGPGAAGDLTAATDLRNQL